MLKEVSNAVLLQNFLSDDIKEKDEKRSIVLKVTNYNMIRRRLMPEKTTTTRCAIETLLFATLTGACAHAAKSLLESEDPKTTLFGLTAAITAIYSVNETFSALSDTIISAIGSNIDPYSVGHESITGRNSF